MRDEIPESLYERLYGRALNDAARMRLLAVKDGLGLSARDELWPVVMSLDYYAELNRRAQAHAIKALNGLPAQVEKVVSAGATAAGMKADQAVAQAVDRGVERLTRIVVDRSRTTADRISRRQFLIAAAVGGTIVLLCLGVGAAATYFHLKHDVGICATPVSTTKDGRQYCFID